MVSAKMRKSATPKSLDLQIERAENQRISAKICENVRSGSGFSLLLSPFWRALNSGNSVELGGIQWGFAWRLR